MTRIFSFTAAVAAGMVCLTASAFATEPPVKAAAYIDFASVTPRWTGFYVGLNAGYGWSSASTYFAARDPLFGLAQADGSLPNFLEPRMRGFVGGGQIGYSWQFGQAVVGLEADIAYSGMKGDDSFSADMIFANPPMTTTQKAEITWLGTVRPRIGWLWTPSVLVYASGGLAYGGVKVSTNVNVDMPGACPAANGFCSIGSRSTTRVGWTVGGGVESFIGSNWSVRAEYLYFDLGHESDPIDSTAPSGTVMRAHAEFNGHIVRAGLNYHF
jgi:outer membrane immunogenic protein